MPDPSRDPEFSAPSISSSESVPAAIRLGSILAWLGTLISLLLVSHENGLPSFFCPARGGCEAVLSSRFAAIGGVPLPIFGAVFYAILLGLWLAVYAIPARATRIRLLEAAL